MSVATQVHRKARIAIGIEHLLQEPSLVRQQQRGGGPTAVMQADRIDPDDIRPNASHKPRTVHGWQRYCPLRRMALKGGNITSAHIIAADMLRTTADIAALGFSADQTEVLCHTAPGPRAGPPARAHRQANAINDFKRAMKPFSQPQVRLLTMVVLRYNSVPQWCRLEGNRTGAKLDPKFETGRLVATLEVLTAHYQSEIERGLRNNTVLEPVA